MRRFIMEPSKEKILLTLNGGSSSLKFGVFSAANPPTLVQRGHLDHAGDPRAWVDRLFAEPGLGDRLVYCAGVGHRIVHGGPRLAAPALIDAALLTELKRLVPLAPEHLPAEIALIEAVSKRFPDMPQVACFDTAFHRDLPRVAQLLPLPRRYMDAGMRRYGFHGLSYEFLLGELARKNASAARGRVILAHLGNGASLAAIRDGRCIDTSMGFTPAAGLVMGSRTGDLDPGVLTYIGETEKKLMAQMGKLINHESGLVGISGTTSDMRELLKQQGTDPHAADAVNLFCYQARKWVGAFAATLGGLDTLVFAGGIGENCPEVRARICTGLDFLGLELDTNANARNAAVISVPAGRVTVHVIPTDEELTIARHVRQLIASTTATS